VLRARGEDAGAAVLLEPGQTPFGPAPDLPEGSVALLDQGVRELCRPGVIVDHHVPEVTPRPEVVVVSSFGETPETPTAPLTRRLLPDAPAWLAAVGAFGDLGRPGLDLPECAGAAQRTAIAKLVPLVNAPRRVRGGPVRTALALLGEHEDARAALADPRVAELQEARAVARAAFQRAVRTAPQVGERVAVIRLDLPFQVHPLVATTWARRLAPRPVLVANDGWIPGRVNFSIRGGTGDLRALLRAALPAPREGAVGNGHPRATGGSLTAEEFEMLLRGLHDTPPG
jgi:single-stranded-DNA-specific exonuclease